MTSEQPEDVTGYLDALMRQSQGVDSETAQEKLRAQADDLTNRLNAMDATSFTGMAGENSGDERVSVVVDGRGGIQSIDITPHAMRDFDADALAQACTEAIVAARKLAASAMEELTADLHTDATAPAPPQHLIDLARSGGTVEVFRQAREAAEQWTRRDFER